MEGLRVAVQFIDLEDQPWWQKYIVPFLRNESIQTDTSEFGEAYYELYKVAFHLGKIRQYQKRKTAKDMFVRPEKPEIFLDKYIKADLITNKELYESDLQQWENWQPVFVEKDGTPIECITRFDGLIMYRSEGNLDVIITHEGIGTIDDIVRKLDWLFWNPENETVKKLYYVDK